MALAPAVVHLQEEYPHALLDDSGCSICYDPILQVGFGRVLEKKYEFWRLSFGKKIRIYQETDTFLKMFLMPASASHFPKKPDIFIPR